MHKIIIVEDDVDLLEYTTAYLRIKGFEVTPVASVLDFFQALTVAEFDIAIVDIGLPDKSGFDVVAHLRNHTNLGIIVMTAKSSIEDKIQGYNMGADHYFVKPVESNELVAVIGNLLSRQQERKQEQAALQVIAPTVKKSTTWQLDKTQWLLYSPEHYEIKITAKERLFLELLADSTQEYVKREQFMAALQYDFNTYGYKALEALVRRLRNKIKVASGTEAPIKTIYAKGYCFLSLSVAFCRTS
jgi:DNA-binding response OmpR family regulator